MALRAGSPGLQTSTLAAGHGREAAGWGALETGTRGGVEGEGEYCGEERVSLNSGDGGDLPPGLRARSEEHEDFSKVAGMTLLDVTNDDDRHALEEVSHFSRYALAIYTW